jgi:hypothetical protein
MALPAAFPKQIVLGCRSVIYFDARNEARCVLYSSVLFTLVMSSRGIVSHRGTIHFPQYCVSDGEGSGCQQDESAVGSQMCVDREG